MDPDRPHLSSAPSAAGPNAGYLLSELTAPTLKTCFAGSPFAARLDSLDRCIATARTLEVAVLAGPSFNVLLLWVLFTTRGRREEVLEFCNRFNQCTPVCRAQLREKLHEDGGQVVIVSHERLTFPEERLTSEYVVRLVDAFTRIVHLGMAETGPGDLVWTTLKYLDVDPAHESRN